MIYKSSLSYACVCVCVNFYGKQKSLTNVNGYGIELKVNRPVV